MVEKTPEALEAPSAPDEPPLSLAERLQQYEKDILVATLRRHNGNLSAAGRELDVSPRMMNYRVSRLNIKREEL